MAYPDLPPSPTFWRCPSCANESLFYASGIGQIVCGQCSRAATEQQLLEAHARDHGASPGSKPSH